MKAPSKKELLTAYSACTVELQRSPGDLKPVQQFLNELQHTDKDDVVGYFTKRLLQKYPQSVSALQALAVHFLKAKRFTACMAIMSELKSLIPDDPRIDTLIAQVHLATGANDKAKMQLAAANMTSPHSDTMLDFSCQIAIAQRDWDHVLSTTDAWLAVKNGALKAWQFKSQALFELTRFSESVDAYRHVLKSSGSDAGAHIIMGRLCITAEIYPEAERHLLTALDLAPSSHEAMYGLSDLYRVLGRLDDSLSFCRRALSENPDFPLGYVQLSKLQQGELADAETAKIVQLLTQQSLHPDHRASLEFALADSADKSGEYDKAFRHYQNGNAINRQISNQEGIKFLPNKMLSDLKIMELFFENQSAIEEPDPETGPVTPIFIVGMPRSGTTLLESILASHSKVVGAGELRGMPKIYTEFVAYAAEHSIAETNAFLIANRQQWREAYFEAVPGLTESTRIVDKQPINYQSVGLIRSIFPQSPILHIKRPPLETSFSIFRHNFSKFWPFAHELKDIGTYYYTYAKTCHTWHRLFGEHQFSQVSYSDLVCNLETEARRIIDICGLDWEDACLQPHLSERPITTPSSVQVRTPISNKFAGRSQAYISNLQPLIDSFKKYSIDLETGDILAGS